MAIIVTALLTFLFCATCRTQLLPRNNPANTDPPGLVQANTGKFLERYFSNDEMEAALKELVKRCSPHVQMFRIGQSVGGQNIWALQVTNASTSGIPKPSFRYVGGIHGDEPLGRQLLPHLATYLCEGPASDPHAVRIFNEARLYLIPAANPDGFELETRENEAGKDLNRDFPDPHGGAVLDPGSLMPQGKEQPETLALMSFIFTNRSTASAALHEGAVVANYPWDGYPDGSETSQKPSATPDDGTFQMLAKTYAKSHEDMANSQEFAFGITNGAQWYPVYGGMQDWSYVVTGCLELTLELSQRKWPSDKFLQRFWQQNSRALVALPYKALFEGVRGRVYGASPTTGIPPSRVIAQAGHFLNPAAEWPALGNTTIQVVGINSSNVTTGMEFGDFYRPLAPGKYVLMALREGYNPQAINITVPETGGVMVEIFLEPLVPQTLNSSRLGRKVASWEGNKRASAMYVLTGHLVLGGLVVVLWVAERRGSWRGVRRMQ